MKRIALRILTTLSAVIMSATTALPVAGADLSSLVAEAAKYESGLDVEPLRQFEKLLREAATNPELRRDLEAALAQLLAPTSALEAKRFACTQLAIIGTEASLPALAEALKHDDTVGMACLALGNYATPKANEVLRTALYSMRGMARAQIINTLGDRGDTEVVKTLLNAVINVDKDVADAAMAALGKIANPDAIKALAGLRAGKPSPPEGSAATSVDAATVRLAEQASLVAADKVAGDDSGTAVDIYTDLLAAHRPPYIRRAALEGLLRLDKDGGEKRIAAVLKGTDPVMKPSAIAQIAALKSAAAVKKFAKEMTLLQVPEQVLMIQALSLRSDSASRKAITDCVASQDTAVRAAAMTALGQGGDASTVPVLVNAFAGAADAQERQVIENTLVGLKGGAAVDEALLATLKQRSATPKPPVIAVLGKRGSRAAVPVLLAEAVSPDGATATAAFQALGKMARAEDLASLLNAMVGLKAPGAREAAENAVAQALAKTTSETQKADAVCAALARATDVDTRLSLIRLLATCGGAKALSAATTARMDKDQKIREAATRTLMDWPDLLAWTPLSGIYTQTEVESLRVVALRALVRLAGDANAKPDTAQIDRYRALLAGAKNDNDRKLILGALAGCAHPEALPLALALATHPALKAEAQLAVKKIAEAIKAQHPQAAQDALLKLK